jgi:hypothetical protein
MKGGNDNPTVAQFNFNKSSLRLLGSQALAPVRGNTKHGVHIEEITDDKPLPKRKRKQKLEKICRYTDPTLFQYFHTTSFIANGFATTKRCT